MKTVRWLLLLLVLLVSPAASQVPDDKLITPGVGIGRWTLQMTIAELFLMNGIATPLSGPDNALDSNRPEGRTHTWGSLDLLAAGSARTGTQPVDYLATFSEDYKTAKGISVGVRRDAVELAYGKPTAVTLVFYLNDMRLIYDEIGLFVRMGQTGAALSVGVFRPGTARLLWKF